jgi:hypothetical protein
VTTICSLHACCCQLLLFPLLLPQLMLALTLLQEAVLRALRSALRLTPTPLHISSPFFLVLLLLLLLSPYVLLLHLMLRTHPLHLILH